jgi:hypothetical protein
MGRRKPREGRCLFNDRCTEAMRATFKGRILDLFQRRGILQLAYETCATDDRPALSQVGASQKRLSTVARSTRPQLFKAKEAEQR